MSVVSVQHHTTAAELYNFTAAGVERQIRRREGGFARSFEPLAATFLRAADPEVAFAHAALRRPTAPRATGQAIFIADLFAGCGGLSVGAHEAATALGFSPQSTWAVETSEAAGRVFSDNFPSADLVDQPLEDSIDGELGAAATAAERRIAARLEGLTLALAGPPCQGHSDLNNHTRRDDPKNRLYLRAARFIEVVRPVHAIIENVPGVAHDRSRVVERAVDALREVGYRVDVGVAHADNVGAAQARRRHLLLATLDPTVTPSVGAMQVEFAAAPKTVLSAIGDLGIEPSLGEFGTPSQHSAVNESRIRFLFEHDIYDLPDSERPDCHRLKPHSYKAVYGRMRGDRPAPTITSGFGSTGQGRFVHPLQPRTMTPHEAARVQGFPDYFTFRSAGGRRNLQQMIGNAVPTRLAFAAVASLLR